MGSIPCALPTCFWVCCSGAHFGYLTHTHREVYLYVEKCWVSCTSMLCFARGVQFSPICRMPHMFESQGKRCNHVLLCCWATPWSVLTDSVAHAVDHDHSGVLCMHANFCMEHCVEELDMKERFCLGLEQQATVRAGAVPNPFYELLPRRSRHGCCTVQRGFNLMLSVNNVPGHTVKESYHFAKLGTGPAPRLWEAVCEVCGDAPCRPCMQVILYIPCPTR